MLGIQKTGLGGESLLMDGTSVDILVINKRNGPRKSNLTVLTFWMRTLSASSQRQANRGHIFRI